MNTEHAAPGDTIEVTHPNFCTGQQFVVIERPVNNKFGDGPGDVWAMFPTGLGWLPAKNYKILKRANGDGSETEASVDFEKSLRQKRDALLRGYFT